MKRHRRIENLILVMLAALSLAACAPAAQSQWQDATISPSSAPVHTEYFGPTSDIN